MHRTYYTGESSENEAKPYAALEDGSIVPIAPPLHGENVLMGPAGGFRSSVNDLLTLYKAFMGAALHEIIHPDTGLPDQSKSTIRGINQLWKGHQSLPFHSLREHSYGFGWARADLWHWNMKFFLNLQIQVSVSCCKIPQMYNLLQIAWLLLQRLWCSGLVPNWGLVF
ncbi:Beta-lactamase/transpeptidase-like [Penicillium roqueforti FM164]|uniref:Beta-lactamase/transpeptidase-like n=1 Tax=Penicillium roqueforti (strain FM164) TaxID=1365484 RepID=W6QN15_PENRF|nr:Beta-lactamase/transpeptidase-like [Penicillium roqueforti FM164]